MNVNYHLLWFVNKTSNLLEDSFVIMCAIVEKYIDESITDVLDVLNSYKKSTTIYITAHKDL